MSIVLQNSTLTGNTAIGQESNLMNFTKVMLKTDSATYGDSNDYFPFQTSERDAGDASADTSGRQLDGFIVTFDRPVDPSEPGFDTQGRLLIGTDDGIWRGGGDDLLIGGRTTFDVETDGNDFILWRESGPLDTNAETFGDQFRGGITVAVGDIEQVNPTSWGLDRIDQRSSDAGTGKVSVHDISISKQCDDAGGVNALLGDGSVRHVNDAAGSFFAYGDGFIGGVSVAASDAPPSGHLYLATDVGVFEHGTIAGGGSWGLDRIDTGYDLFA